jgi:hypothetical protein
MHTISLHLALHALVPHASARGRPREWASGVRAAAWVTCMNLKRSTPSSAADDSWRDKQGRAAHIDLRQDTVTSVARLRGQRHTAHGGWNEGRVERHVDHPTPPQPWRGLAASPESVARTRAAGPCLNQPGRPSPRHDRAAPTEHSRWPVTAAQPRREHGASNARAAVTTAKSPNDRTQAEHAF